MARTETEPMRPLWGLTAPAGAEFSELEGEQRSQVAADRPKLLHVVMA